VNPCGTTEKKSASQSVTWLTPIAHKIYTPALQLVYIFNPETDILEEKLPLKMIQSRSYTIPDLGRP
jgi:hypothetical protein